MKNYALDLIFWGAFTDAEREDVREYLVNFAGYVNGAYNPPGFEPAVRYYGLWGVYPANWINDSNPLPAGALWGQSGGVGDGNFVAEINAARNGSFGTAFDFNGNATGSGLATGPNRLAIMIIKGTNELSDSGCMNIFSDRCMGSGVHNTTSGVVWAAVQFNQAPVPFNPGDPGTVIFPKVIAHEIIEAMTDPELMTGWVTREGLCVPGFPCSTEREACDQCDGDWTSLPWTASTGDDITGLSQMVLNPSYGGINSNITADSCQTWEPEEYAPMAAMLEFGGVALVYRQPNGHLGELLWQNAGSSATGPWDLGQPAPGVTAQGKPSIAYAFGPGEYVFVRGSDNALWMEHNGTWTSLGGVIFGDPSAVFWNNNSGLDVFVLGTDDNIYAYVIVNGTPYGFYGIDNNIGRVFSGPPKAFSRSPSTVDVFAVGQNGHLEWIPYSSSTGWSVLTDLGLLFGNAHHNPVSITSWGANRLDIIATSGAGVASRGWNGSWASDYDSRNNELGTPAGLVSFAEPSGTPAIVSWGTNRLDAFMVDRKNQLTHAYYNNGTWFPDANKPMRTDAVGDPQAVSRGVGMLDVFYRTTTGSLTHLAFNNGWTTEANVLPAGSIQ